MTLSARIDVRSAAPQDVPRLREIWRASFGDDGEYLDFFLQNRFVPDDTPVLTVGGTVVSQLFLLPAMLRTEGRETPVAYLFAAATDPAYRGRGYMRRLLQAAEDLARAHGIEAVVLLPGSAKLYDYYAGCGYETAFARRQWDASRAALRAASEPAGDETDAAAELRGILRGQNGVVWDDAAIRYALEEHRRFRGSYAAAAGVFAAVEDGEATVIAAARDLPRAFELLLRLDDAPRFALTLPPDAPYGTRQNGGMIRFLYDAFPVQDAFIPFPME